jgi:hypothetical protein
VELPEDWLKSCAAATWPTLERRARRRLYAARDDPIKELGGAIGVRQEKSTLT